LTALVVEDLLGDELPIADLRARDGAPDGVR
jgi:hypothetical protein